MDTGQKGQTFAHNFWYTLWRYWHGGVYIRVKRKTLCIMGCWEFGKSLRHPDRIVLCIGRPFGNLSRNLCDWLEYKHRFKHPYEWDFDE